MKVTEHVNSKKFSIELTDKEFDAICARLAREEGYQEAQGNARSAKLLNLMWNKLLDYNSDWD